MSPVRESAVSVERMIVWNNCRGAHMKDDVVFLGEQPCPRPYDSERVPIYRVIRKDHPYFGQIFTEQQVLLSGLYFSGLAPRARNNFNGFPVVNSNNA
ncbi:MAG: hypothetical protein FJ217_08880 [Ignavibacteria bacterium]|nr:hypothetical protein [Ignavibacteria bacterium]